MYDREMLRWSSLRCGGAGRSEGSLGGGNGASAKGLVGLGGRGLGANVGGGGALGGEGGGGEEGVMAFCPDFTEANVVPHLVLPPLTGNEVSLTTGVDNCESTTSALETSRLTLPSSSCSCSGFRFNLCCSSSKAIHSSFSRFFSATSKADESDAIGVHTLLPSSSSNLRGLASRRFWAELVD